MRSNLLKTATLLILSLSLITSCSTPDPIIKGEPVQVWKGSSFEYGIIRRQGDNMVSCLDRKFDDYMCMDKDDFKRLLETYDGCNCE